MTNDVIFNKKPVTVSQFTLLQR